MATFLPGFEVQGPIGFATPTVNYRRNLATAQATIEIGRDIEFSSAASNYRRNLATAQATIEVRGLVEQADPTIRKAPVRGLYQPSLLVDVVAGPFFSGDSGLEIVFNIPNRLRIRPHLIAPLNGTQHRLAAPVMVWTPTIEAAYYEVHVARDIDFLDRVARLDVVATQVQKGWPFGGTYYWRVRAVAGTAWSDYSEVWSFTVPPLLPATEPGHDTGGRSRLLNQFREDT